LEGNFGRSCIADSWRVAEETMRRLLACLLLIGILSAGSLARDRTWTTGTLVNSETQRGTRTVGIPSSIGSGPMIATLRNDIMLYTIDDGKYVWVVSRRMIKKHDKPIEVTINATVKFAVENQDCYLLDDQGKEYKLVVEKKTLKTN
jgi:hypothetical protein